VDTALFISALAAISLLVLSGAIIYPIYLYYLKNIRQAHAFIISYRIRAVFAIGIFLAGSYLIYAGKYSGNKATPYVASYLLIRKWQKQ
jgi:hypothetical protein